MEHQWWCSLTFINVPIWSFRQQFIFSALGSWTVKAFCDPEVKISHCILKLFFKQGCHARPCVCVWNAVFSFGFFIKHHSFGLGAFFCAFFLAHHLKCLFDVFPFLIRKEPWNFVEQNYNWRKQTNKTKKKHFVLLYQSLPLKSGFPLTHQYLKYSPAAIQ